jgi:ribokinase
MTDPGRPRIAVVGHVEYVDFVPVPHFPASGEVLHGTDVGAWAGGGGGVAAGVLAELGAEVDFFCALGEDEHGRRTVAEMEARGIRMHVAWRQQPTRRAVTLLEPSGERTIVTLGDRLEPSGEDDLDWGRLDSADGVFLTAGDRSAAAHARRAGTLVVSPRAREAMLGGITADVLIFSANDHDEADWARRIGPRARWFVATEGVDGGRWWGESEGRWSAAPVPGPIVDSYGCGDAFMAALAFALGRGDTLAEATHVAAVEGARMLTRRGAP